MTDLNLDALTAALLVAEADAEAAGWGDEDTFLFRVVGEPADPYLELMLQTEQYPVAAVQGWIADGLGLGGESQVLGVVAVSEAWRHLDDDELREARPEAFDNLIDIDDDREATWAQAASLFRDRTRPRDLPDHLRAEVRVGICVLRDGAAVQIVRDRGSEEVTTNTFDLGELPGEVHLPAALLKLLLAPGRAG